jgi:hypothetical protein
MSNWTDRIVHDEIPEDQRISKNVKRESYVSTEELEKTIPEKYIFINYGGRDAFILFHLLQTDDQKTLLNDALLHAYSSGEDQGYQDGVESPRDPPEKEGD